jgi:uncharacterized protein (DUF488 family)
MFTEALAAAAIDMLVDVRMRRGVRGHEYAWANKERLMAAMEAHGIQYLHVRDLATPDAIRKAQYQVDSAERTTQRHRQRVSSTFRQAYGEQVLDAFDFDAFRSSLPADVRSIALMCVETEPEACHRSLIASEMHHRWGLPVTNLMPPDYDPD